MANSVDPDQTALIGAVCSGSTLLASILNLSGNVCNVRQLFAADDSSRHFQMHFFLGALRVKSYNFIFSISQITVYLPLTHQHYPSLK